MIRVNRLSVPFPLNPNIVARAKQRLADWYQNPEEIRRKQKLDLESRQMLRRDARPALNELFRRKCAYCESQVDVTAPGEVDLFRPAVDASNLSGEGSPDHYGWLSADWENMYLACPSCAR